MTWKLFLFDFQNYTNPNIKIKNKNENKLGFLLLWLVKDCELIIV